MHKSSKKAIVLLVTCSAFFSCEDPVDELNREKAKGATLLKIDINEPDEQSFEEQTSTD